MLMKSLTGVLVLMALTGCTQEPSDYRLRCDKYCSRLDALLDEKCGSSGDWELCKPWIEKVGPLADEISTELEGAKDAGDRQYVLRARTNVKKVREGIKGYAELRCHEKLDVGLGDKKKNSRFFDCTREWQEIGTSLELLSIDLSVGASSKPYA